jgi:hypothetical protein
MFTIRVQIKNQVLEELAMKKLIGFWGPGALLVILSLTLMWTVPATADHHMNAADGVKNVYICGCGPACGCDMMADKAGNCPCGKPLLERRVLKEDADKVYVCACADGCNCALDKADPTKCGCGKELRAYPKKPSSGCAHGMQPGGGCDKPCGEKKAVGCDKPCCEKKTAGSDKPCDVKPAAEAK